MRDGASPSRPWVMTPMMPAIPGSTRAQLTLLSEEVEGSDGPAGGQRLHVSPLKPSPQLSSRRVGPGLHPERRFPPLYGQRGRGGLPVALSLSPAAALTRIIRITIL